MSGDPRPPARPRPFLRAMARDCIANKLRLLNRAVTGLYDQALRPHGLKVSQMNVLVAVSMMGEPMPGEAGRVLRMEKSTLSRNVERMRARGWIEVLPGGDARSLRLRVTPEGRRLLEKARPAWEAAQRKARRLLGEAELAAVDRMARALRRSDVQEA